mmetsp:Transcript_21762/g.73203  ORF Transcript_21762/g.73203 Transcript_21762/m.73203 type:complete len:207 (-) Transcript_21762:193-813(-)
MGLANADIPATEAVCNQLGLDLRHAARTRARPDVLHVRGLLSKRHRAPYLPHQVPHAAAARPAAERGPPRARRLGGLPERVPRGVVHPARGGRARALPWIRALHDARLPRGHLAHGLRLRQGHRAFDPRRIFHRQDRGHPRHLPDASAEGSDAAAAAEGGDHRALRVCGRHRMRSLAEGRRAGLLPGHCRADDEDGSAIDGVLLHV